MQSSTQEFRRTYFNSQPHKEADSVFLVNHSAQDNFNSQPHKEADPANFHHGTIHSISTHSLTRRLTCNSLRTPGSVWYFNSQPHKEADRNQENHRGNSEYFNSQPHKEADGIKRTIEKTLNISTHSLTRRLTEIMCLCCAVYFISTHSLTRRLTTRK